jgi:YVTN family beta-propeller protein
MKGRSLLPRIVCTTCLLLWSLSVAQRPGTTIWLPDSLGGLIHPFRAVYDSENASFYVGGATPFVLVVDARSGRRTARISIDSGRTQAFCYNWRHNKIYAASSGAVSVIDGHTNAVVKTIAMGRNESPNQMIYVPGSDRIYGAAIYRGIRVFDCEGDSVVGKIDVPGTANAIYYSAKSNRLACAYFQHYYDAPSHGGIVVFDCANNSIVLGVGGVGDFTAIALDEANDELIYRHGDTTKTLDMSSGKTACLDSLRAASLGSVVARGKSYSPGGSRIEVVDQTRGRHAASIPTKGRVNSLLRTAKGDKVIAATDYGLVTIDTRKDTVVATTRVGAGAALCYAPALSHLLCVNTGRCVATLYDCSSSATIARIRTGAILTAMCLDSRDNRLYLADVAGNAVIPVDCRTWRALPAIPLAGNHQSMYYNNVNNKVYVAHDGLVSILDCRSNTVSATIRAGGLFVGRRHLNSGDSGDVVSVGEGYVSLIDGHGDSLLRKKRMDASVSSACYNPGDDRLYLTAGAAVKVADCSTFSIVATVDVKWGVAAACLDDKRNVLYVAADLSGGIAAISCEGESVVGSVPAGAYASSMCMNTANGKAYCANRKDSTVIIVGVGADSILARVKTGKLPHALCYNPSEGRLYCVNEEGNSVTVVDGTTDQVIQTIPVGALPIALEWNPADGRTYVLNRNAGSVSVLTSAQ